MSCFYFLNELPAWVTVSPFDVHSLFTIGTPKNIISFSNSFCVWLGVHCTYKPLIVRRIIYVFLSNWQLYMRLELAMVDLIERYCIKFGIFHAITALMATVHEEIIIQIDLIFEPPNHIRLAGQKLFFAEYQISSYTWLSSKISTCVPNLRRQVDINRRFPKNRTCLQINPDHSNALSFIIVQCSAYQHRIISIIPFIVWKWKLISKRPSISGVVQAVNERSL